MRIAVYAIAKDEAQFARRFCESALPHADVLVVADTGSRDGTADIVREYTPHVHAISVTPWRFDVARNAALALVPADVDVCVSLDLDEVLLPGWRDAIEQAWSDRTTRLRHLFDNGGGNIFYAERVHARVGVHWHHPCHETLRVDKRVRDEMALTSQMIAHHLPDQRKSRGQYLPMLRLATQEDPHCPRNAIYYGRELCYQGQSREAIAELQRYLALPAATWADERAYAMRLIGDQHEALGDHQQAVRWYMQGVAETPSRRDPWYALARSGYHAMDWPTTFAAAVHATALTDRPFLHFDDPAAWAAGPHDLAAIAAYHLGMRDVAAGHGQRALDADPTDPRLAENLRWYTTGAV